MSSTAARRERIPAPVPRRPAEPGRAAVASYGAGFWLIALAFVTGMAFSTVPTPLYPLYQAHDGFSTFTVTIVFAVYVVGVLTSLLLAGQVSDLVGRRKVLTVALALELAAALLFVAEPPLPLLLVARVVTGLGVGMLTATATAWLQELHHAARPGASPQRFEIVSTAANIGGLGLGPLIAGVLAQYLEAPLRLPYLVFAVLLLAGMAAVALAPETVEHRTAMRSYRPARVRVEGDAAGYLGAAAAGFAAFAVFALFTSLAPGFVGGTLHHSSRALAGLIVFAVFAAAAVAQTLTSPLAALVQRRSGLLAQAAGVVVLALGMHRSSLALFLAGGIVANMGAGVLFKSAVGAVAAMASPATRGEALAGLFLISFVGLAVPAVGIGLATHYTSATAAVTWFTGVLLALLAAVAALTARSAPARRTLAQRCAGPARRRR